jgi:hypothetical protein
VSGPYDSDVARHEFAVERSHRDAEASNATARATAQAAILINGGAATAVLAFLTRGSLDECAIKAAAFCLGIYAIGVGAGACMMYCSSRSLDHYSQRWHLRVLPQQGRDEEENRALGEKWWKCMKGSFLISIIAFVISSFGLAFVIGLSNPIEQSGTHGALTSAPSAQQPPAAVGPHAITPQ